MDLRSKDNAHGLKTSRFGCWLIKDYFYQMKNVKI